MHLLQSLMRPHALRNLHCRFSDLHQFLPVVASCLWFLPILAEVQGGPFVREGSAAFVEGVSGLGEGGFERLGLLEFVFEVSYCLFYHFGEH